MFPPVYFIKTGCTLIQTCAIHEVIEQLNSKYRGKKQVNLIQVRALHERGPYEAVILFDHSKLAYEFTQVWRNHVADLFRKGSDVGVSSLEKAFQDVLEFKYPDYPGRFYFDMGHGGNTNLWVHPRDDYRFLTGDQVCNLNWNIRGYASSCVSIENILVVGPSVAVRNSVRRYRKAVLDVKTVWNYRQVNGQLGDNSINAKQWEFIASALGVYGAMYLFTSKGLVIKVNSSGMRWVRPVEPRSSSYYQNLVVNGFMKIPVPFTVRSKPIGAFTPTPFEESVGMIALTEGIELNHP